MSRFACPVGFALCLAFGVGLLGCAAPTATGVPTPTEAPFAPELTITAWAGYFPQTLLDRFKAETGVTVHYVIYEDQESVAGELLAETSASDVVVIGTELLPGLIAQNKLAVLDFSHLPNFRNVSVNFRDLAYDPGNAHSVPFAWGTSGLLMRTDQVSPPITRWADLWDARLRGKVLLWELERTVFQIALKSLGYSINTEQPAEVQAAYEKLLELKANATLLPGDLATSVEALMDGTGDVAFGWAYDGQYAQDHGYPVAYVLPAEGTILWNEHLVIPAASPRQRTAEAFINFMLQPENGALFVNAAYYPIPVEGLTAFLDPAVRDNPFIYPPLAELTQAELSLPLSPAGQQLYDTWWAQWQAYQP